MAKLVLSLVIKTPDKNMKRLSKRIFAAQKSNSPILKSFLLFNENVKRKKIVEIIRKKK